MTAVKGCWFTADPTVVAGAPSIPRGRTTAPSELWRRGVRCHRMARPEPSACGLVLFDDALGDLLDGSFILHGRLVEQPFGLFAGAVLAADEQSGGERDLGVVVGVA